MPNIDVKNIAKLSRLELSPAEEKKFSKELSSILDYVEQLKEIKTDNIEPTAQVTGLTNVTREDKFDETRTKGAHKGILGNAPKRDDDHIEVKAIF